MEERVSQSTQRSEKVKAIIWQYPYHFFWNSFCPALQRMSLWITILELVRINMKLSRQQHWGIIQTQKPYRWISRSKNSSNTRLEFARNVSWLDENNVRFFPVQIWGIQRLAIALHSILSVRTQRRSSFYHCRDRMNFALLFPNGQCAMRTIHLSLLRGEYWRHIKSRIIITTKPFKTRLNFASHLEHY